MRNTVRLGTIFGIELKLDYSWFIIFVLITWSLAGHYFPDAHPGWSTDGLLGAGRPHERAVLRVGGDPRTGA